MDYEIKQKYITGTNRPGKALTPQGIVIHSTATPGAPAINIRDYFGNHPEAKASAHVAIDWTTIIEIIPCNENAWHAGPTANRLYLGIELCEPKEHDLAKFQEVWNRAVWYVAKVCKKYGWNVNNVHSHDHISKVYKETDHTDPIGYFVRYGKTWADFLLAVDKELKGEDTLQKPAEDWKVALLNKAKEQGLITGLHHPDDPVPYWAMCSVALKVLEKVGRNI